MSKLGSLINKMAMLRAVLLNCGTHFKRNSALRMRSSSSPTWFWAVTIVCFLSPRITSLMPS